MDQITHDVRSSQWLEIITQCQNRPEGTTARQWMADNGISEKSYYYWLRKFRKQAYSQMNITLRRSRLSGVARATFPDKQSHLVINYCIMF